MQEWVKIALAEKGGGLIILLIGIMLAIAGSHRLLTDDLEEIGATLQDIQSKAERAAESAHKLDKRVTILELRHE